MEEERLAGWAGVLFCCPYKKKNKCSKNLLHCQEKNDMIKQTHVLHAGRRYIDRKR